MAKGRFIISDTEITTDWDSDLVKYEPRDLNRGSIQVQWQNATGTLDGVINVVGSFAEDSDFGTVIIDSVTVDSANNNLDNWAINLTMPYEKIGLSYVANGVTSIDIKAEIRSV